MKSITLKIDSRNSEQVSFRVKNTHRQNNFGADNKDYFTASNYLTLKSVGCPQVSHFYNIFYVQGRDADYDNSVLSCSPEFFAKIEAAVKEYNDYFSNTKTMKTNKPRLKIEEFNFNNVSPNRGVYLRIDIGANPNLRAFRIVECSGFESLKKVTFNGWTFISDWCVNAPLPSQHKAINVWGTAKDHDAIIFVTKTELEEIQEAIRLMNAEADKPDYIKEVTFVYKNGGSTSRRFIKVTKEDDSYIEGIDADKSEFRKFLKSKIVGEVKEVK